MSKLRIVVLETDDADASTVAAIGNMIREMQNTRGVTSIEHLAEPLRAVEDAPPQLPATNVRKAYKRREPKAAPISTATGTRKRASGVTDIIVAAVAKNGRPNLEALAKQIYGEATPKTVKRVQLAVYATATKGRIHSKGDGSYSVS